MLTDNDAEIPSYFQCFDDVVRLEGAYRKEISSSRRFLEVAQSWYALGVFGADVIDGTYSEERALGMLMRIYEARCAGMPSKLLGSSVKDRNISPIIKDTVGAIGEERFAFRDEISRNRFAEATGLQCDVVADAAFLLVPRSTPNSASTIADIADYKQTEYTVWGLSTNWRLFDNHLGRNEYIKNLAEITEQFNKNFGPSCVVLLPHDKRGGNRSDFSVANDLHEVLKSKNLSSIRVDENIKSYEVKEICKNLEFVLSMRMHLAIAAMGVSCPVASISYQGKFNGLYKHFGIQKGVLDEKKVSSKNDVWSFVKREFENRSKMRSKTRKRKKTIRQKSTKNFEFII